jgi:hypothetical protein
MVFNIRGTGGAGKSTLVKRLMAQYRTVQPVFAEGRKQPLYYVCSNPRNNKPGLELLVPGHYEIACGGCDTLKSPDMVYDLVKKEGVLMHRHVVFEGIIIGDDVKRLVDLHLDNRGQVEVIALNTSIEDCLKAINDRRQAKKADAEAVDPKNTINRAERLRKSMLPRLKDSGVPVSVLGREDAFVYIAGKLDLLPSVGEWS